MSEYDAQSVECSEIEVNSLQKNSLGQILFLEIAHMFLLFFGKGAFHAIYFATILLWINP